MAAVELDRSPGLPALYGRAVAGLLTRRRSTVDSLPDTELVLRGVRVDPARLAAYARVCGFRLTASLPVTYPHVLAFPVALRLLTAPDFPVPAVGLVHLGNRIAQHRPLPVDQPWDLSVRAESLRAHRRGRLVDVVTVGSVAGEPMWREVSTYLHRTGGPGPGDRSGGRGEREGGPSERDRGPRDREGEPSDRDRGPGERAGERSDRDRGPRDRPDAAAPPPPAAVWRLPAGLGRAYAAVSGDRNPVHLSGLVARGFGFPRRIAHGMWTMARCLSQLSGRLPDAFTVEVEFRSAVLLPSTVAFAADRVADGWDFSVRGYPTGRPHLSGTLRF